MKHSITLILLALIFYTGVASAGDITTRRSNNDEDLGKLKEQLYPDDAAAKKQASTPPTKKTDYRKPPSPSAAAIVNALATMSPEDLEKVKQNLIKKVATNSKMDKKEKKKLIQETTHFYDTLKRLPADQRKAFVSNFNQAKASEKVE